MGQHMYRSAVHHLPYLRMPSAFHNISGQYCIHVYTNNTVSGVLILHVHAVLHSELGALMRDMIDTSKGD